MKKDTFFKKINTAGLALTYDDVRLKSSYSETAPTDVSIKTNFSKNIPLNMPIVSAAMDTVTESSMAIAMALLGGIGVIHKNLTPKEQAHSVARVKYFLNGMIDKPICVTEKMTVEQLFELRDEKRYHFHTFPVVDENNILKGLVTRNDLDFVEDQTIAISELMTTDLLTGKEGITPDEAYDVMKKNRKKKLPIIDGGGKIVGLYTILDLKRLRNKETANVHNIDDDGQLRVAAAIGTGDDTDERMELLSKAGVDAVVIDTAHGDSVPVYNTLKHVKKTYPQIDVVVGNVSEPDSAKRLADAGADAVKVGQGPGSICTTRIIAGIGCPQVSAVYECSKALRGTGVPVCADGGIKNSGDIAIALAAGAGYVMLGKVLAGTTESPGELTLVQGLQMKSYRGMGSLGAMKDNKASRERYRQASGAVDKLVPEGVEGAVAYVGDVSGVIHQYIGGLRAGMGYVGGADISDFQEKADFHRISNAGLSESHSHDVVITKEPPNYSR